jgi:glycerol-3-phosphate acyltransferase PlsY
VTAGLAGQLVVDLVLGFLIGSLNPATVLARLLGRDLRSAGSGNPGATNAGRVLGVGWGVVVGVLDILKGFLPAWYVLGFQGYAPAYVIGIGAVLGHIYSPFLGGRGGKGVATALGTVLALHPWWVPVMLGGFAVGSLALRRVGAGSMLAAAVLVVLGVWRPPVLGQTIGWATVAWAVFLGLLVLGRHWRNAVAFITRRR